MRAIGIRRGGWTTGGTDGSTWIMYSPGRQLMESNTSENSWMILFLSCRFPFRLDLGIGMGFMLCWGLRSSFDCPVSLFVAGASDLTAKFRVTNPKFRDDCSPSNIGPLEFTMECCANISITPTRHVPSWSIVAPPKTITRIGVFLSCTPVIF